MCETEKQQLNVRFTKMHGLGNDYVYIDCLNQQLPQNLSHLSQLLSERHTGIGSDGIILIMPSEVADFKMRIFNADGSEARMCGNGSRCVGKFVRDHGLTDKDVVTLETLSGIKTIELHRKTPGGEIDSATVNMGSPSFEPSEVGFNESCATIVDRCRSLKIDGGDRCAINAVGMGNPHGVVFLTDEDFRKLDIEAIGPRLENHPAWSDRANIEFAVVDEANREIKVRVWERGSGETMACGTGACATAVAAIDNGLLSPGPISVTLPGGTLTIDWINPEIGGNVMMTGPATTVFDGIVMVDCDI